MTVYVDDAYVPAAVANHGRVHRSRWCHLMADTVDELLAFGKTIGLQPAWLQVKPSGVHFDVTEAKRRQAIAAGAVEISVRTKQWSVVVAVARGQYVDLQADRGR